MAAWAEFATQVPEMAEAGRRPFSHSGSGVGYVATVRLDGAPRLHPINSLLAAGRLVAFIVPWPKLGGLRRDGRYAWHSTGAANVDEEFCVAGRAAVAKGLGLWDAALAGCS